MSNPPAAPLSRATTPSTPPFLNIMSPDLRSLKTILRSPGDDRMAEMDFEAAYAILTKSPTFQNQTTPVLASPQPFVPTITPHLQNPLPILPHIEAIRNNHQFPPDSVDSARNHGLIRPIPTKQFTSPPPPTTAMTNTSSNSSTSFDMSNDIRDLMYKGQSPPIFNIPSPTMPQGKFSPLSANDMVDLENLAYFSKYDELLSTNETNALEQFLDSIIDDKKIAGDQVPTSNGSAMDHLDSSGLDFDQAYKLAMQELTTSDHGIGTSASAHPHGLGLGLGLMQDTVVKTTSTKRTLEAIKSREVTIGHKEKIGTPTVKEKRQRKRRKTLSDEQKKLNHTTSEQKRRGAIKDAFDGLVKLLPSLAEETRGKSTTKAKAPSKSVVLESTAFEIQRLISVNNHLRKILNEATN